MPHKASKGIRRLSCLCSICLTQLVSLDRWAEAGSKHRNGEPSLTPGVVKRAKFNMFFFTLMNICTYTLWWFDTCTHTHAHTHTRTYDVGLFCLSQPTVNRTTSAATLPHYLCLSSCFLFSCQNSYCCSGVLQGGGLPWKEADKMEDGAANKRCGMLKGFHCLWVTEWADGGEAGFAKRERPLWNSEARKLTQSWIWCIFPFAISDASIRKFAANFQSLLCLSVTGN